ncbi:terminase small subunit [Dethiosulfovibrio sp. F2B]|uniref:terminase small subunit n=1 Tax=Dethiosulfovibrio faecalis TaxID=2720018 RepID=UPI001F1D639F|nr:terminase small subunit [Dethiosulfovibrio faecalis]
MAKKKLTAKQKAFVSEYLVDLNATAAAIRAGYSERSARKIGANLLTLPHIQAAIQEAMTERRERVEVTQDYVLTRLKAEAELKGKGASHVGRIRALELLGKHLGMFVDRSKIDVEGGLEIYVSYGDEKGND